MTLLRNMGFRRTDNTAVKSRFIACYKAKKEYEKQIITSTRQIFALQTHYC